MTFHKFQPVPKNDFQKNVSTRILSNKSSHLSEFQEFLSQKLDGIQNKIQRKAKINY